MSFQTEFVGVARGLAQLASTGTADLTDHELDVALHARGSVIGLCRAVYADLAGSSVATTAVSVADLELNPVKAFGAALRHHPRVSADTAPTDALSQVPAGEAGRLWLAVARHALAAEQAWDTGTLDRPTPEVAWAGIADLAAVAGVVAELDEELAHAATALPGRSAPAVLLARAVTSGLRLAAREVALLADRGPLDPAGPQPRPAPRRAVIAVRSVPSVVAAQHQLATLVQLAPHLRPERLEQICQLLARTCDDLGAAWTTHAAAADPQLRQGVGELADLVRAATGRRPVAGSISGGDPLPAAQAHTLQQALARNGALLASVVDDRGLRREFVKALCLTTQALHESAVRHLQAGEWLTPSNLDHAENWRPWKEPAPVPDRYLALGAAAERADVLATTLTPAAEVFERYFGRPAPGHAPTPAPPSARTHLAPAPVQSLRGLDPPPRPLRPGEPLRPAAPSAMARQTVYAKGKGPRR